MFMNNQSLANMKTIKMPSHQYEKICAYCEGGEVDNELVFDILHVHGLDRLSFAVLKKIFEDGKIQEEKQTRKESGDAR